MTHITPVGNVTENSRLDDEGEAAGGYHPAMSNHPESLGAFQWRMVRLYCPDCHRIAQFSKVGLVMRFGGEVHGHTLLKRLRPCDRRTEGVGAVPCQVRYWDLMSQEAREKALTEMADKGGLPKGWAAD